MSQTKIQSLSKAEFEFRLKKNREDIDLIDSIETLIRKERSYIFQLPERGGNVILLLSGGMDSIIAWQILMDQYKLHVFPISIKNKVFNPQGRAINYFSHYYKIKYPDLFHKPYIINNLRFDSGLRSKIHTANIPSSTILDNYDIMVGGSAIPIWSTSVFSVIPAYMYSLFLYYKKNIHINTIVCGITADDGLYVPAQTLSFMRLLMFILMRFSCNKRFQFGSIYYDRSLRTYMRKRDVTLYGYHHGLPLMKTYSCDRKGILHCGECQSCTSRKYCFEKNHIKDGTLYMNQVSIRALAHITKRFLQQTFL
jgi:7-cyano-7-deazaguanine synthase in queuosine biosynthesis